MKIRMKAAYRSIGEGSEFEIPSFCVITGRNGSGKSHLLEAMARVDVSEIHADSGVLLKRPQLVAFGALNPQIDETCEPQNLTQMAKSWWGQIHSVQNQVRVYAQSRQVHADPVASLMENQYGADSQIVLMTKSVLRRSGKDFMALTEDDVSKYSTFNDGGQSALFASQLATIFKAYFNKRLRNSINRYMNENEGASYSVMSNSEFIEKFGPAPWDLVNDILERAGLSYRVVSPENQEMDSAYRLRLIDSARALEISANDLSTGEKVLMSLAVAIYNTHEMAGKPDVLMLDEPDAPLHPQYSKLLMETLREVVSQRAGISVVMTTHSPSTVAMCRDNELFEMDREAGFPRMISVGRGLDILTSGIPHLKVSIENRRQVFVESKYDVEFYQLLFNAINRIDPLGFDPIFLEPHSGTSNCSDVINIVGGLHRAGGDLVRGIVDWDLERATEHPIYVLGDGNRYSIENYLLDPIFIGLSLVRSGRWMFSDCACPHLVSYVSAREMSQEDYARIVQRVFSLVGFDWGDLEKCHLMNGWVVDLPRSFLRMRGHDWETLLLEKIPALNSVLMKNRGEAALKLGVLISVSEYPQFLSSDVWRTLRRLG